MRYHPAAGSAWQEVAGAWLAGAIVAVFALGFAEFDAAVAGYHYAVRAVHTHLARQFERGAAQDQGDQLEIVVGRPVTNQPPAS
jgi:hypothetical protein